MKKSDTSVDLVPGDLENAPAITEDHVDSQAEEPATGIKKNVVHTLDEFGLAERFLDAHGDKVKYLVDIRELFVWDGRRYGKFPHLVEGLVKNVIENIHLDFNEDELNVTTAGQQVEKADLDKFQAKSRSVGMIKKTILLLRCNPRIYCKLSDFDTAIYQLNCLNGLLDLEAGTIEVHNPSQLVTKLAPVHWNPDAECPEFNGFIHDVFLNDNEMIQYIQRTFGYCLSGSTQEEVMQIAHGNGANAKSLTIKCLRSILGSREYALTLGTSSILNSKFHGIRCDLRQLEGVRTAFAIEVNRGATLDEAVIKALTGGDEISARAMRENNVQFTPQAKILMAVNHLPSFTGIDRGIKRRLQVIPFRAEFDGSVRKEEIERKLAAEYEGILVWAVAGFQSWRKQGLNPPAIVLDATADYFAVNDHIGMYLADRVIKQPGASTPLRMAFEDYETWCKMACVQSVGLHHFGELLRSRGFTQKRKNASRYWDSLQLKAIV